MSSEVEQIKKVSGMYEEWFLDYASYVILERAIPSIHDGLKPVQRRVMHSLWELEDGRYNKVANVVGNTMKYHPHGDASITDAMVQLGQKELLIDTQGNWGNIFTGDNAAAARYIEARLSPFAMEVVFNPKITPWQASYDGRNKEPIHLPVKFPILLAQGVEGIAVGLSTKILPHNFNELIEACICHLKGKSFELYPDFPTGGIIDVSQYNDGRRGGRVRARAKITQRDRNILIIDEIPFGATTASLIESISKAAGKGKLKIRKVDDNTAEKAEIFIRLGSDVSPEKTIDALYAFTDCELSISPLGCVIDEERPLFLGVSDILKKNADHTVALLKQELEIALEELREAWHFASLERIFIEKRIYRKIEEQKTWEALAQVIAEGLRPYTEYLLRAVTEEDIVKLTEIRIRKISRFDLDKSQQLIESLEEKMREVKYHLEHPIEYAIAHFKNLQKKYGKGRGRKTEIRTFESIDAAQAAAPNTKLYVDRKEGFIGTALKKEEFVFECSDIDDIIVFRKDGAMLLTKVSDKAFVGKDIIHLDIWKKKDQRTIYNLIYRDGKNGAAFMKRFAVTGLIREQEYSLTQGKKDSEALYFSANPNGEAEEVTIHLKANPRLKKLRFTLDLAQLAIKSRNAKGNLVSKHPVKNIKLKRRGVSTLPPRKIWFDETLRRLNTEGRGRYLGEFSRDDKILSVSSSGLAQLIPFDLEQNFHEDLLILEKWSPEKPISCVYFHGMKNRYFVKRFLMEDRAGFQRFFALDDKKSFIEYVSTDCRPVIQLIYAKEKNSGTIIRLEEVAAVKGIQAQGNPLSREVIWRIDVLKPLALENFGEAQDSVIRENSPNWADGKDENLLQEGAQGLLNL